jgi:phasin family protein
MAVMETSRMAKKNGETAVGTTAAEPIGQEVGAVASAARAALAELAATPASSHAAGPIPAAVRGEAPATSEGTTMEKAIKTAEDIVSFGQGNLEAVMKSGQIWTAGVQDIGKQFAASAQAQIDQAIATMKAIAQAKSLKEAIDLQASHARATVEKAMAETSKLTDASLKLAEQAMAPITARVTLAFERFGRAV